MQYCSDLLQTIKTPLQLFSTLAFKSGTQECTLSSLKRIKTYVRTTISQERLNGLWQMAIVKEITKVFLTNFVRRMQLQDW